MIKPIDFYNALEKKGVDLYAGVPDSLLANFCTFIDGLDNSVEHVITANEGNAVALAIGYHLATNKVPAVYMQNSGLGNTINPLASLADSKVYKTPILLIIGWRGEPGIKDEPQHIKQGEITLGELELHDIPYSIMDSTSNIDDIVNSAFEVIKKNNTPFAIVVKKNTFAKPEVNDLNNKSKKYHSDLVREDVLKELLSLINYNDLIVSTTGKTSREIFEIRALRGEEQRDFLTVGGMGHTSSIALGVSIGKPNKKVICIDGDGSLIMHMGSMPVISDVAPANFIHILLNNEAHESVGGQRTSAEIINFKNLTYSVGYKNFELVNDISDLKNIYKKISKLEGPSFIEIRIKPGSRSDLGRPTSSAEENKKAFMSHVKI
jgi:phosphonopyruvate decarboxylase